MEGIGINLPLLVAFLVSFLILFVSLGFVLYKPALKMLDERQAKIKDSMEQAEQIKEQTARSEEEIKAQLEKFRDGDRGNDMNAMMRDIAKKMTDEDIEVLSKYVGGLH